MIICAHLSVHKVTNMIYLKKKSHKHDYSQEKDEEIHFLSQNFLAFDLLWKKWQMMIVQSKEED